LWERLPEPPESWVAGEERLGAVGALVGAQRNELVTGVGFALAGEPRKKPHIVFERELAWARERQPVPKAARVVRVSWRNLA
jgi:hypothetical protein